VQLRTQGAFGDAPYQAFLRLDTFDADTANNPGLRAGSVGDATCITMLGAERVLRRDHQAAAELPAGAQ